MANGAGLPHLADATDLERWADQRTSQADLPRLIRRLVRHENDQVQRVEMRGGEGVGLPGYDGTVEATRVTPFVPDGLSVWEMGTGKDIAAKANKDYRERTDDSLGVDMATTTFVFVTPRRWREKKEWEKKKRDEGKWRDVLALDADDIEQALEEAAAVRIWLSELLDMPTLGVATIEEWWRRFSNGFNPRLTSSVVLAGRADHAAELLRRLTLDVGRTFIRAASVDDGLAFVACSMMAQGTESSEPMLSRSLLVHDGSSLRRLDTTSNLLILLPYEEHLQREARLIENHHVVFVTTDGDGDGEGYISLPPLDHLALQAALSEAGVPGDELPRYVRAGNKSLLALQRVATRFGQPDPDLWAHDLSDRAVRRAWLAGAWNQMRSGDVEVLEGFTGRPADDIEERLRSVVSQPDPLFARVGGTWAVAAAEDSWRTARHAITEPDLDSLERAVQTVLGAVDPRLELPPDERWSAALYGKVRVHSTDLRMGLARTIALLGARGDEVRLSGGRSARQWAERVVLSLLQRANQDSSAQLWASMEDVLPLLAEAAPDVFLRAVAQAVNRPQPLMRNLFQDQLETGWNASSPHTGLLWALECVAWSGSHLGFAAELLAVLSEIDPGGKLSNRPSATLRDIFRPAIPQTSAPAEARLSTLDALLSRHRNVAWDLLIGVLGERAPIVMQTHKPLFREWARDHEATVTYGEYFEMVDALSERVVQIATSEPARWAAVIPEFDRLPEQRRRELIVALETLDRDRLGDQEASQVWNAAEDFVRRNRHYSDADWALADDWLLPLAAAAQHLQPSSASESHSWLFDDWHPDIGISAREDFAAYEAQVRRAQSDAVTQILNEEGFHGLMKLAERVQLPASVGSVMAPVSDEHDYEALSLLDDENNRLVQFADGFARTRGAGQISAVRPWVQHFVGRPLLQARLLQTVKEVVDAWGLAAELGEDVEKAYWSEFNPYGRGADFPNISLVAKQLLIHGRAAAAIDLLSLYADRPADDLDVKIVVDALKQFGTVEDPEVARVSSYDLSRLLDYLRSRGVDETEIALLEWKFLSALIDDSGAPSLQHLLARDPAMFVQLIEIAFKPSTIEVTGEPREVDPALAANAYRLLREWRIVPGTTPDDNVDHDALEQWLEEVRTLLDRSDRLEVGELQIGEVFAYAPADTDGTFPTRAVREMIETAPSDRLERGFVVGLLNKRGVTSRALSAGGQQEYQLAQKYEHWAQAVDASYPRTAQALRSVADSYREEGRRHDEDARRFLEGLDR